MALTLVSSPAAISNLGSYNITTSLVEDSTHVNLRVRAEVYHEGIVKATSEKPKGISDFDFAETLKSLIPGLRFARDSGSVVQAGSSGGNLVTSWSVSSGTWDTLTSAANAITSAVKSAGVSAFLKTNDIAVDVGDLLVVHVTGFSSTGVRTPYYIMTGDNEGQYIENNKSYLIMATSAGNINLLVGNAAGEMNFALTGIVYKISTNRTTVGGMLAPYKVKFTEVYEDASGVTQSGATWLSKVYRFADSSIDNTTFAEYVLHDSTSLFANKTFRNNVTKIYTGTPYEYWLCFYTEYVPISLYKRVNEAGSNILVENSLCFEGWGAVILNEGEILSGVTSAVELFFLDPVSPFPHYSETITIRIDSSLVNERTVLEYDGDTGGKEYLAFEGIKDVQFTTQRNYYTGSGKNRKPLSFKGYRRQRLETRLKDINNASYLESLLVSENVKKLEASYATPKDVTVVTESVKTENTELFTNQIEIEYER